LSFFLFFSRRRRQLSSEEQIKSAERMQQRREEEKIFTRTKSEILSPPRISPWKTVLDDKHTS
jgi:hypothetical protein